MIDQPFLWCCPGDTLQADRALEPAAETLALSEKQWQGRSPDDLRAHDHRAAELPWMEIDDICKFGANTKRERIFRLPLVQRTMRGEGKTRGIHCRQMVKAFSHKRASSGTNCRLQRMQIESIASE